MRGKPDQQRFEALLREHLGIVFKVAGAYAPGREDRDDLAPKICAQCWRSFARFDVRRAKFSTWMYRVALNVARRRRAACFAQSALDELAFRAAMNGARKKAGAIRIAPAPV